MRKVRLKSELFLKLWFKQSDQIVSYGGRLLFEVLTAPRAKKPSVPWNPREWMEKAPGKHVLYTLAHNILTTL